MIKKDLDFKSVELSYRSSQKLVLNLGRQRNRSRWHQIVGPKPPLVQFFGIGNAIQSILLDSLLQLLLHLLFDALWGLHRGLGGRHLWHFN
jgi:hypothetical protein